MRVILIQDVKKIGRAGEMREVAEGYVRNFLIPRGLAAATGSPEAARAIKRQQDRQMREGDSVRRTLELAENLARTPLRFALPADKNGHLYSGLNESEILVRMSQGRNSLEKSIKFPDYTPLKTAGEHKIEFVAGGTIRKQLKIIINQQSDVESQT